MHASRLVSSNALVSKFVGTYTRLLQGSSPSQISPNTDNERFWSDLLALQVDSTFLYEQFGLATKEDCLDKFKPLLNTIFKKCLNFVRTCAYSNPIKSNSVETLSILTRCILNKSLAGWEVMEVFAGGVHESDTFFMDFVGTINELLGNADAPVDLRHQVLRLALIFVCSIGQLSPGAYFLRHDLFPSICAIMKAPDTQQFSFEAVLLLSVLANFHRSDAGNLNPYVNRIKETTDADMMRKICWTSEFALDTSIKSYQSISDDSPPTFFSTVGSFVTNLRPDRALASVQIDPPHESFKNQPIEASLVLLPIYELLRLNRVFPSILMETLSSNSGDKSSSNGSQPLPLTVLTLSSYVLTHATSSSSPRATAYANISLNILLEYVDNSFIFRLFCEPYQNDIRLCRQRLPVLTLVVPRRPPACALLDCCVLWLRHNLHKKLQSNSYRTCIRICYKFMWLMRENRIRLEYHWQELWRAIVGLLDFLSNKLDSITRTSGIDLLARETVYLLDFALCNSEALLRAPYATHECIYELVHSVSVLRKQKTVLQPLTPTRPRHQRRSSLSELESHDALEHLLSITEFYVEKIRQEGALTARDAMRVVAKEVEKDGVHGAQDAGRFMNFPEKAAEDVSSFAKYAAIDGLSLML